VSGPPVPSSSTTTHPGAGSRERLRTVGHYLTAAVLALKGWSKLEHPEGHRALIGVCFASAAVIVIVTALHRRLHAHAAKIEALVYVLEAAVAGAMAVVTVEEGKRGLPFAWAIAAAGFLAGAAVRWRWGRRTE
jgi:chromate transport protein ChrA